MRGAQVQGVDAALLYGQAVAAAYWRTVVMALFWASTAALFSPLPLLMLFVRWRVCVESTASRPDSGRYPASDDVVLPTLLVAVVATPAIQESDNAPATPTAVPRRGADPAHLDRFYTSPTSPFYEEKFQQGELAAWGHVEQSSAAGSELSALLT